MTSKSKYFVVINTEIVLNYFIPAVFVDDCEGNTPVLFDDYFEAVKTAEEIQDGYGYQIYKWDPDDLKGVKNDITD